MHGGTGNQIIRNIGMRLVSLALTLVTAALIVVAAGTAAGRWRVWPVRAHGAQTSVSTDDALLLVPVPFQQVHDGDRVVLAQDHKAASVYRVRQITDSIQGRAQIVDKNGALVEVNMPAKVWRMSHAYPGIGRLLRLLAGPIQAALMVLSGIVLIARAERRRSREDGHDASNDAPNDAPPARSVGGWLARSRQDAVGRVSA